MKILIGDDGVTIEGSVVELSQVANYVKISKYGEAKAFLLSDLGDPYPYREALKA